VKEATTAVGQDGQYRSRWQFRTVRLAEERAELKERYQDALRVVAEEIKRTERERTRRMELEGKVSRMAAEMDDQEKNPKKKSDLEVDLVALLEVGRKVAEIMKPVTKIINDAAAKVDVARQQATGGSWAESVDDPAANFDLGVLRAENIRLEQRNAQLAEEGRNLARKNAELRQQVERLRGAVATAWSSFLEVALADRAEDGTSLMEMVLAEDASLRTRLEKSLGFTRTKPFIEFTREEP
jgi:hypothetical protein